MKTVYYLKKYSSSDESDEYQSRGNKNPKPKYSSELQGYLKVHVPGYENCLFWSLDILEFNGYFGSYAQRQLVYYHVDYNKDAYIDNIEGDFSKYIGKIGWNSRIVCILKHDWCLNWALVWCQRFLNKAFTNSIFNWEENKWSLSLMITWCTFLLK